MIIRRLLLLLLSPIWVAVATISVLVGMATLSGANLPAILARAFYTGTAEGEALAALAMRVLLLPLQLVFVALVVGAAVWVFRRRHRFGSWVLGDPLAEKLIAREPNAGELPSVLQPGRRRTLQQIFSSAIAVSVIFTAAFMIFGQFVERADLAVVFAALSSSLTWGARLPIGDLLGGLSNIFESNLAVGDRIRYKHIDLEIDGTVELVDLRFLSVRSRTGELTSIPFGDLRVFRNYSRGEYIGVYATFPVLAADLARAVGLLFDLAPTSTQLVPELLVPWQAMSREGIMGKIVDIVLFGETTEDLEDELQISLHAVVQQLFAERGIRLAGAEGSA